PCASLAPYTTLFRSPQLFGSAVEAGVPGQEHPDGALLLLFDVFGDIAPGDEGNAGVTLLEGLQQPGSAHQGGALLDGLQRPHRQDRKSTRLNSSHVS